MARKTNFISNSGQNYFRTTLFIGYDSNGKKIQKQFYGKTRKEALEKKELFKNNSSTNVKIENLAKVMNEWLFNIVIIEVKASSFERYEGIYRNYIKDSRIASINVITITTQDLQVFLNSIYEKKKSANIVKTTYNLINKFFNYQLKTNTIIINPCQNVVLPKDTSIRKNIDIFTKEEIEIFKKETKENFEYFIFYFALATGMRQGEIIALKLEDIDLVDDLINISKTTNKVNVFENGTKRRKVLTYTPKSKNSIRTIPIPIQIKDLLIKQINFQKEHNRTLLFTNQNGDVYCDDRLYRKYQRLLKRNNIPARKFHTLRHTYCSILARNNVPLKMAAELMGHDVEMTSKIYTHLNLDDKKNAIKNINF